MSLVLACLLAWSLAQDDGGVQAALARDDFEGAWHAVESWPEGLERWRARAEILYRAGDPGGSLAVAREGLAHDPAHLQLLFHAAGAALWLQDADLAAEYSRTLQQSAATHPALDEEQRRAWGAVALDFSAQSQRLALHEQARERALTLARACSLAVLTSLALLIGWLAWSSYGRSSRPVS